MRAWAVAKKFKNNKQEKKSERSEKLHTSIRRAKVRLYQEKNDLSLELNEAVLEAFWISELRELIILGPLKRSENFLTFVL